DRVAGPETVQRGTERRERCSAARPGEPGQQPAEFRKMRIEGPGSQRAPGRARAIDRQQLGEEVGQHLADRSERRIPAIKGGPADRDGARRELRAERRHQQALPRPRFTDEETQAALGLRAAGAGSPGPDAFDQEAELPRRNGEAGFRPAWCLEGPFHVEEYNLWPPSAKLR